MERIVEKEKKLRMVQDERMRDRKDGREREEVENGTG